MAIGDFLDCMCANDIVNFYIRFHDSDEEVGHISYIMAKTLPLDKPLENSKVTTQDRS